VPLSLPDLNAALHDLFTDTADRLARDTSFCRRNRALSGPAFAQAVVFTLLHQTAPTLEDFADFAAEHLDVHVTPNAFDQRFTPQAADFLCELLAAALDRSLDHLRPALLPVLRRFAGVYLRDATVVQLPDHLAPFFPGRRAGRNALPTAAVKLVLEVEVTTGEFTGLSLLSGTDNDKRAEVADKPLPAGSLLLEDMGFLAGDRLQACIDQGAYSLSRVPAWTAFFRRRGQRRVRLDLLEWLRQQPGQVLDRRVHMLHDHKLAVRLLAVRVPEDVARQRQEAVAAEAKQKGRPVSRRKLELCAWNILVTNAPAELVSAYEAGAVRRVRWQIELIFKLFKSEGGLERTRGRTRDRVLAELYGKLLALLVQQWALVASGFVLLRHSARRLSRRVRARAGALVRALGDLLALARLVGRLAVKVRRCRVAVRPNAPSTFDRLAELDYDFRQLDVLADP
jgi:hypothetical protein